MATIDMHVHTWYSRNDGIDSPEKMIRSAEKKGLDAIAITDHDTFDGYENALNVDTPLTILCGCEISSKEGHILAYNIRKEITKGMSALDTIHAIHKQGGYAIASHPLDKMRSGIGYDAFELPFDAIEARNGHNLFTNSETETECIKRKIPMIAGSDAHMAKEVGSCYITIPSVETVFEDIISGLAVIGGAHVSSFIIMEKWIRSHIFHQGMK